MAFLPIESMNRFNWRFQLPPFCYRRGGSVVDKARLARVNRAKSAEKHTDLHSASQSLDCMTNAGSLLYKNSLVNQFMEKMVPISPLCNTGDEDKANCRPETDDTLSVCPMPLTPTPSVASYQRAVLAAINYTKNICINEEAQMRLIHLLLCLEQTVDRNYAPCAERPPTKVHDVLHKMHPVFTNDTPYRCGKSSSLKRNRSLSGLSNNSRTTNDGALRRRHRRFCLCCLEDSASLEYSMTSGDESRIRFEKDVERNIRTDDCVSDTTENGDDLRIFNKNSS
nr:potassium voltage gated channel subfamily D [Hymenolepis microstoma]